MESKDPNTADEEHPQAERVAHALLTLHELSKQPAYALDKVGSSLAQYLSGADPPSQARIIEAINEARELHRTLELLRLKMGRYATQDVAKILYSKN